MVVRVRSLKRKLILAITVTVLLLIAVNLMTGFAKYVYFMDVSKSHRLQRLALHFHLVIDGILYFLTGHTEHNHILDPRGQRRTPNDTNVKALLDFASIGTKFYPLSKIYRHYHQLIKLSLGDMVEEYEEKPYTPVIHEDRKRHLKKQCDIMKATTSGFNATLWSLWYFQEADMLYCPVPKVGSTFWRRAWNVILANDKTLDSPFQFSFGDFNPFERGVNVDLKKEMPKSLINVLFTRDPYQRLFSAYVDKFLSPNIYLWGIGKQIIRQFRPNPSNQSFHCGHDVTFDEFVKYVIARPAKYLNEHYRPIHMLCDVCNLRYDVIGKLETFKDDSMFLLNRLGVLGNRVKFQNMKIEQTVDSVVDLAVRIFSQRNKLERCLTFHVVLIRMWRHLQISGIISKGKSFPLTPARSESITIVETINTILEAYISSHDAKSNKQEAFLLAYQQISPNTMEQLKTKFHLDFKLFDYNDQPDNLFNKTQMKGIDFDYFDVLTT